MSIYYELENPHMKYHVNSGHHMMAKGGIKGTCNHV